MSFKLHYMHTILSALNEITPGDTTRDIFYPNTLYSCFHMQLLHYFSVVCPSKRVEGKKLKHFAAVNHINMEMYWLMIIFNLVELLNNMGTIMNHIKITSKRLILYIKSH